MNQPPGWRVDWDACPLQLREVLRQAVGAVGIVEVPPKSNRGERIDVWNLAAGAPVGSRYCVAYIRAMYDYFDGEANPLPRTASVSTLVAWAKLHGHLVHAGRLLPGDVACKIGMGPSGDEHHHAMLVVADLGDGRAALVEANHNDGVWATIRGGGEFTDIVRVVG